MSEQWEVRYADAYGAEVYEGDRHVATVEHVATEEGPYWTEAEIAAHAGIIAAAPDMMELLREWLVAGGSVQAFMELRDRTGQLLAKLDTEGDT